MDKIIKVAAIAIMLSSAISSCKIQEAPGAYARAIGNIPPEKLALKPADTVNVVPVPAPVVRVMEGEQYATSGQEIAEEPSTNVVPDKRLVEPEPEARPEVIESDEPQKQDTIHTPKTETKPEQPQAPKEQEVTRSEKFKLVTGQGNVVLKNYHVVIGSFGQEANALRLQKQLQPDYHPILVVNERGMYRVLLESYDTYAEAKAKITDIQDMFPDAWCLVQKQ